MATLRNTAIGLVRVAGLTNIAKALRTAESITVRSTTAGKLKREFAHAAM